MAKKKRRRSTRKPAKSGTSPLVSMLFGLAVGLSVAVAVYVKDRQPGQAVGRPAGPEPAVTESAPTPASMQDALDDNGETATASEDEEEKEKRFTFYDILPNFEVVTPEEEPITAADVAPEAIVEPGVYVLQAGSFSTNDDADRRRAELALHGIESHIQRVKVNDRNYHRVYIGPTDDLDELNMLRSRLRVAKIDVFRIRLSDD
ncbi:MAG: SPOR domain-containing protein [Gammaproteobacteria bacterium]|nr:SPOR domain-containing protein [Gammaproteobacteria bacterium]